MRVYGPRLSQLETQADTIGVFVGDGLTQVARTTSNWYRSINDINTVRTLWLEYVDHVLLPLVVSAYHDSADDTLRKLEKIDDANAVTAALIPKLITYLTDNVFVAAKQRLVAIGDVLWNVMHTELTTGLGVGDSIAQLRTRLRASAELVAPRARNIAKTEIIGVLNAGSFNQVRAAQVTALKTWIAKDDDRTRASHRDVNGTQVDMNAKFIVGGHALDYPHDPLAPPEETYNCRCTLVWEIVEKDQFTEELVVQSLTADGVETTHQSNQITAAAYDDKIDGAMIALIPSDADLDRLTLDGYETRDELHLTLFYLGDAVDISEESINQLVSNLSVILRNERLLRPVAANAFGVAHWNLESEYPAWVLNVGDAVQDNAINLEEMRHLVNHALDEMSIEYPQQHTPWQPHICIAYSKDDLYSQIADKLGPVTFDTLRVAYGTFNIDIPLMSSDVVTADANAFHLLDKHNQKSHGNRAGKKDNIPGRTSKHAPIIDEITERNSRAPQAQPTPQNIVDDFETRISRAAANAEVFNSIKYGDREQLLAGYEIVRKPTDPTVTGANAAVRSYQGGGYYDINYALRIDDSDMRSDTLKSINGLDALMNVNETTEDIVVYRGTKEAHKVFGGAWNNDGSNVGMEWEDDAYVSTTADFDMTSRFVSASPLSNSVKMRVLVPKGTKVIVPDHENPWKRTESELLLNRGQRFRVVRDYVNDEGARTLDVEVIT